MGILVYEIWALLRRLQTCGRSSPGKTVSPTTIGRERPPGRGQRAYPNEV
jgi:hypothetical protein